jgi:hypothetical protein
VNSTSTHPKIKVVKVVGKGNLIRMQSGGSKGSRHSRSNKEKMFIRSNISMGIKLMSV